MWFPDLKEYSELADVYNRLSGKWVCGCSTCFTNAKMVIDAGAASCPTWLLEAVRLRAPSLGQPTISAKWVTSKADVKTGFSCNRCKEYSEYAASNQPNGTYVCFNCRT